MSDVNLLAFRLIGTGALAGYLVFKPARILRYLLVSSFLLVLTVGVTGLFLDAFIDTSFRKGQGLLQMQAMHESAATTVHRSAPGYPSGYTHNEPATVRQIKERGVLRVGYVPFRYPFSFFNEKDELVGFDIEIANSLAADLGVALEFIPVTFNDFSERLSAGSIDLMSNVAYLPALLDQVEYSDQVLTVTAGFIVKDHRRHDFATVAALQKQRRLRIAVAANPELVEKQLRAWLPSLELNLVEIDSPDRFFETDDDSLDALLTTAEVGTAFTLLYPDYAVVVPKPVLWRLPQGFAAARGNFVLSEYLDRWVAAHKEKGTFQRIYDHWILGEGANPKRPRWSVIRNVLHWVE